MLQSPCHAPATTTPISNNAENFRDRAILALTLTDRANPDLSTNQARAALARKKKQLIISNNVCFSFCVRARQQTPPNRDWLVLHRGESTNC
jgi:hypothetical protein